MPYCDVLVPGPWWNGLTYKTEMNVPIGARVVVPLGRGERIGFVQRLDSEDRGRGAFAIRSIRRIIDEIPLFPPSLWELFDWGGRVFLCGTGELLRIGIPSVFLSSSDATPLPLPLPRMETKASEEVFLYLCDFKERCKKFIALVERSERFLVLFPEQGLAAEFWKLLPESQKKETVLWPSQGGKKLLAAWIRARNNVPRGIIGGPGAVFAPLQQIETIIVDEESSGAYRSYKKPFINARTLAGKRARLESASLVLSGRTPSSRIFLRGKPRSTERPARDNVRLVDLREAFASSVQGVGDSLPLTHTLLTETKRCLASGRTALWLLDRKGYAGEIACEDCGNAARCPKCGTAMVWEEKYDRLRCHACASLRPIPQVCPVCRGHLLIGKRPGLEALFPVAKSFESDDQPALFMEDFKTAGKGTVRSLVDRLSSGGIVVGTRAALVLCDIVDIGFAGWIDVDAEVRSIAYQAKFTVFSMVWESLWRGKNHSERVVLLQSRRPGAGWQKGVVQGWKTFWTHELKERKELGLPPYSYLLEIQAASLQQKSEMLSRMEERGLFPMDPGDPPLHFWVTARSVSVVQDIIAPFFSIGCSKNGFPEVSVWID